MISIAVLLLAASAVFSLAISAQEINQPLTVTSTGDQNDTNTADGVCLTSSQGCTLRAAIAQANANPGADTINFSIPGSNVHTIQLGSELRIDDPSGGVLIDGYSQQGATRNTDPLVFNAAIKIQIRAGAVHNGFTVLSAENTFTGLSIYAGINNIELRNEGADGNAIVGNIIGTNVANSFQRSSASGILMNTGPDQNIIGTPAVEDRNVISGNGAHGIRINHGGTSNNLVQNNIIGLNSAGNDGVNQGLGIDLQWWTWGNQIGGLGPNEGNLFGGNGTAAVDISHMATGNNVIGNRIGTMADGVTLNSNVANTRGVIIKDDPKNNYVGYNIIRGNLSDGIWHKQNYTGTNTFANNRVENNGGYGINVTGHDDIYFNNVIANNDSGGVNISNVSSRDNANSPDERTERTSVRLSDFHGNGGPGVRLRTGAHPSQDQATVTGIGAGEIYGQDTCAGCTVDIYASGSINGDGTVTPGPVGVDHIFLVATNSGMCVDVVGNSSAAGTRVVQDGCDFDAGQQMQLVPSGTGFTIRPKASNLCLTIPDNSTSNGVNARQYACNGGANQQFRWSGNSVVVAHSNKCLAIQNASTSSQARVVQDSCTGDSNRRFHPGTSIASTWIGSVTADSNGQFSMASADLQPGVVAYAIALTPDGETSEASGHLMVGSSPFNVGSNPSASSTPAQPAQPPLADPYVPVVFECSANAGVLTWSDASANAYYVFATTAGVESYLGGHSSTSLTVNGADSYRVQHFATGFETNAFCDGPGPDQPAEFTCTATGGVLSWDDAAAGTYYVFQTTAGVESYLGGHNALSLNVPGADSYRVEHWISGQTNAFCDGPGGTPPVAFTCSVDAGTLSWVDAGANAYYVFAIVGGVESYLGGHTTTSLVVDPADGYRVEHWISGQTNAFCNP